MFFSLDALPPNRTLFLPLAVANLLWIPRGSRAAVGAVIEAITDDERPWGDTFEVGAVTGGAQSGIRATRQKEQIVRRCLRGRGYKVLN